jgi:uncharacterized protein with LGFP repeats
MAQDETAGGVNVSGSQGVQAGTGNTQYNYLGPKSPLDPVVLSKLNPHIAVARLQERSHDELVDFFAGAAADIVSEMLVAFLEEDEAMVIAVLADINRRKAIELISPLVSTAAWLARLPEAAEAIVRRGLALKWTHAGVLERFQGGYTRKYKDGHLFWHDDHGVHAVIGLIEIYHAAARTSVSNWLRFPTGDQETALWSPFGTSGIRQSFENGTVYSSKHGIYFVHRLLCFEREGGGSGWLGFPVGELLGNIDGGMVQFFEGGAIYRFPGEGALAVRLGVMEALYLYNEFRPVSKEVATQSSLGTSGRVQHFLVNREGGERETAVYSTSQHVLVIAPEVWNYYRDLGGEDSWLGFPSAKALWSEAADLDLWSEATAPDADALPDPEELSEQVESASQVFEGGSIFWLPETGAIAVSGAAMDMLRDSDLKERLGFPVAEEQPIGTGDDSIQFFDHGAVILRDGKREVLVPPAGLDTLRAELDNPKMNSQLREQERKTELVRLGSMLSEVEKILSFLSLNSDDARAQIVGSLRSQLAEIQQGFLSLSDLGPVPPSGSSGAA